MRFESSKKTTINICLRNYFFLKKRKNKPLYHASINKTDSLSRFKNKVN